MAEQAELSTSKEAFELPTGAKEAFAELASMPEAQYVRLASYVASLPQDRILSATLDRLQKRLPAKDRPAFWRTIHELARLARTAKANGLTEDQAVATVVNQVATADESIASALKERLGKLLREKAVQTHARAWSLLYDEERCMTSCRLITDIRPIFNDAGTDAEHFIVVNHLHIRYTMDQESHNAFFALDEDDIEALSSLASRAKRKIQFLKKIIPSVGNGEREAK